MKYKKVIITGSGGFLGKHVVEAFSKAYPNAKLDLPRSKDLDLKDRDKTIAYFKASKPDIVIAIAARLGGIGDNMKYPASYFYENISIGVNTVDAASISGAKKIINIGTVCSYPKVLVAPFKEEDLWNGYPEPTNGPYGIAKKAVADYSIAVKKQYGMDCVNLLMTNLYGAGDDFRDETSHVIPAIIKKVQHAVINGLNTIEAWGDGSPTRDFVYVQDAAEAIVQSINTDYYKPINIGNGKDISIKELYTIISQKMGYKGKIHWNTSKPNGQPKRLLDISKAQKYFAYKPKVDFETGLQKTIDWYLENKKEIDKLPPKHKNI
jgi:GDP-L-fucose synthase